MQEIPELDNLVGLANVKEKINQHLAIVKHAKENPDQYPDFSMHMIFRGNPGTGKTMVAKILSEKIFKALGISNGRFIQVGRDDLVSGYVGQTAIKTKKVINEAIGGVLFIDEVYKLIQNENDSFGQEALDTLVEEMVRYRNQLHVIVAGYPAEMDRFLKTNSGFSSHFGSGGTVTFDDYSTDELAQICELASGKTFTTDLRNNLRKVFHEERRNSNRRNFGNGRVAREIANKLLSNQKLRLNPIFEQREKYSEEEFNKIINTLTVDDIPDEHPPNEKTHEELNSALDILDDMVGLESVKSRLRDTIANISAQQKRKQLGLIEEEGSFNLNFVFLGNPGTGKTTVARRFAAILKSLGVLRSDEVMEVRKSDLESGYIGQTSAKVTELIERAIGKTLVIKEAHYSLGFAEREAMDALRPKIEDPRVMGTTCIILAGYLKDMQVFLNENIGLKLKFNEPIIFEDYSNKELVEIFRLNLVKRNFSFSERILELAEAWFESVPRGKHFGNASVAEGLYNHVRSNLDARIGKISNPDAVTMITILEEDMPNK